MDRLRAWRRRWRPEESCRHSPLPEAFAAVVLAAILVASWPSELPVGQLAYALVIVVASGASGRWPVPMNVVVAALLLLGVPLGHEMTLQFGAQMICVEALAARWRSQWTLLAVAVHTLVIGALVVDWYQRSTVTSVGVAAQSAVFMILLIIVAAVLGRLRYRLGRTQREHEDKRQAELTALRLEISRDLHDSVAHDLTTMVLRAGEIQASKGHDEATQEQLAAIVSTGQRAVQDMRTILRALRQEQSTPAATAIRSDLPTSLDGERRRLASGGFVTEVSVLGDLTSVPPTTSRTMGQCLVELSNNVLLHGSPSEPCRIVIEASEDRLDLAMLNRVSTAERVSGHRGMGMLGVAERIDTLGGAVAYGQQGDGWWVVEATVPLRRDVPDSASQKESRAGS